MEQAIVRTVDLETTDFPPEADVIELGYVDSVLQRSGPDERWQVVDVAAKSLQKFFKPDRAITHQARATHHIKDSEVADAVHHSKLLEWVLGDDVSIYCAHNADFEMKFITAPEGKYWVDTYKVAVRFFPDFEKHNNQFLRYALCLDLPDALCMPPHRACPDAYTTAHILCHMLSMGNGPTLREMIQWTNEPLYLTKLGFGKHFGKRYDEVDKSYLRWILSQHDMDEAVKAAARRGLGEC